MSIRSFSVHAHFYQPPREDPLTGVIPDEVGSTPYKNWNEKIHAECYRPNADLGNFARISFNVGPTLSTWMETHDEQTCLKIVAQDRENVERFGLGNAIAQAYNHTILPLAPYADKITQVRWGIADFEYRFNRRPQGMWMPETATDLETLSVLADHGIEFTILAPWQADTASLDVSQPYRIVLPAGRSITAFFYDTELSSKVSFDPGATSNADAFIANCLIPRFSLEKTARDEPQFLMIASDGELYGHHQQFRDIFLAHLVNGASTNAGLTPAFPAYWLKMYPPRRTMSIREKTSWSCHHGVMRWMGQCTCTPTDGVWKSYLRRGFDRLSASLERVYLDYVQAYIPDPLELRHRYVHVLLDQISLPDLLGEMAERRLTPEVCHRIGMLLEAQRERQRMFTSCGWYFEDFGRIEPKNNVAYAAQAVYLTRQATGIDLAPQALTDLQHVISHRTGLRGDMVFRKQLLRAEKSKGSSR